MDEAIRLNSATDLTFVQPGERYGTRAGWTATIERINGFRVEGYIDTDYCRHPAMWRQNGLSQQPCNDLCDSIEAAPPPKQSFLSKWIFG